jgi:hypothetical protein
MHAQPLLLSRPFAAQVILAVVVPALFGLLTGFVLGVSEGGYLVLSLLGILGGLAGGYDHDGAGEAALRGICGGLLFGVFILVGHSVFGQEATAKLPDPHAVLVVITTILGVGLHAIGGALRARRERGLPAAPAV